MQPERLPGLACVVAVPVGLLSCAMLVVNNLRDIRATRRPASAPWRCVLGDGRTRLLYSGCAVVSFLCVPAVAATRPWALLALPAALWAISPVRRVLRGVTGPALVGVLGETGRLQIIFGALFAIGLAL